MPSYREHMKTSLRHLPEEKIAELERVVSTILGEFDRWRQSGTIQWRKSAAIMRIILYGSYATDSWVDEGHRRGYQSDYDILVVCRSKKAADSLDPWDEIENRLFAAWDMTPIPNVIRHSEAYVGQMLAEGRYFFRDLREDGIALYEAEGVRPLPVPGPLSEEDAVRMAQEYYEEFFPGGNLFMKACRLMMDEGDPKRAAFQLHQAVENLYNCVLLTNTLYAPPSHNIKYLRGLAEHVDPRLIDAWPNETRHDRAMFELLKEAYVKARYSRQYKITEEELNWLLERVEALSGLVDQASNSPASRAT